MAEFFYKFTYSELEKVCAAKALPSATARYLFNWHYKKHQKDLCKIHNFSESAKQFTHSLDFQLPQIDEFHESPDKTVKFLFRLSDGAKIETVLIPFQKKYTVCLSSQVGCAMNCSFCYTGTQGLKRHLLTHEIVGQLIQTQEWLTKHRPGDDRILNVVYMGQGEPLHNFEAVRDSAEIFMSQYGLSLAGHKITVSTSGYIPGLERWTREMPDINIALSLHSPFDEKRNQLIPINKKYPLADVIKWVETIPKEKKRFVTYEYLVLKNFNDSPDDAHATGELLKDKKALINLIPFNPFPGAIYQRPDEKTLMEFKSILDSYKIPTMIRVTKGDQILAACGQLNTGSKKSKGDHQNPIPANTSRP